MPAVVGQVGGLAVAGEVEQDHLSVLCQLLGDGVPSLSAVTDPVDQDQGLSGSEALVRQHPFYRLRATLPSN